MKRYPTVPPVAEAPAALFESGHLWIQELVDGSHVRFQLRESGLVRFGDRNRVYDPDDSPEPYRHAIRHVRRNLDREALRSAVDDVESVVFFGEAMHRRGVDYDWERTPSVLGFDVWSDRKGRFLPPDAVERIFSSLGLRSVNAVSKEVRATDFEPESYEIPPSAWYDGPAAGVVVRNKTGLRAKIRNPRFDGTDDVAPGDASATALADEYATRSRFEAVAAELEAAGRAVTFEAVYERALDDIYRAGHRRLFCEDVDVDVRAFRSEVAERVDRFVETRG